MKDFKDKVVVITGGATGIGFSFAKQFGNEGAKVVIASRRKETVDSAVTQLKAYGIEAAGTTCDVSVYDQVEALADFAWDTFGHVDVIVNNAGIIQENAPILNMDVSDFDKLFGINVYGVIHGTQVFGRRFVEQGTPAAIYNVGSENGYFVAVPTTAAYVASKHAVLAITDSLREEVPSFIDVSLITPGLVGSEMTEAAPVSMPADEFTSIVMPQLKAGNFYCVSHPYNMVRIDERYNEIKEAFETYAPRHEGDEAHDVRTIISNL